MALHLCRSARAEDLVTALAGHLRATWPDPFEPVPIVVGSRGMERWLRHQLATELGVAAQLAFPFPRQAIDGATALLLGVTSQGTGGAPYWEHRPAPETGDWRPDALAFGLVVLLRQRAADPAFDAVQRYLGAASEARPVSYRELAFAREVADVLDRLMHDRPRQALAWAADPDGAPPPEHRWIGRLLADLDIGRPTSPARLHVALTSGGGRPPAVWSPLRIFGLSTVGPGDRERLAAIARVVDVHLFLLAPSEEWWADVRGKGEQLRALRDAAERAAGAGPGRAAEGAAAEIEQVEREIASQNAVLASLGLPSRDLQVWLEQTGYIEGPPPPGPTAPSSRISHGAPGALQALQAWVRSAGAMPEDGAPLSVRPDDSLTFHAAWGPLRQVEALRDELLALFADPAHRDLEPRDVLVMTPDIETFAPLVAAVFARRGRGEGTSAGPPAIPVAIADLGLSRTNPVAEVLLAVLALADERVTAPRLFELLSLEPVRARFGLEADDVADLRALIADSGMRWGTNAADRASVDQPALHANTLAFGLERLALGALMPDEDPFGVVEGTGELPPVAPLPLESRDRVARAGALGQVVRALAAVRAVAHAPRSLDAWREVFRTIIADFARTSDAAAWLGAQVDEELDRLVEQAAALGPLTLPLAAVRRSLASRFEVPQRGDRPITGAVTVCALQPMRSVPFKVIALLGMDDGAFPRGATPRAWDPFSAPLPGERDPRAVERHLLLETLLSARERLLVSWSGYEVRTGELLPAAVPVEELLDVVARLTGRPRAALVRRHPLQPWSLDGFDPGRSGAGTFDGSTAAAARRLLAVTRGDAAPERVGLAATLDEAVPAEDSPPRDVTLDELADGLARPQRLFLAGRMGLYPPQDGEALADREPIELGGLGAWDLRDRALGALRSRATGAATDGERAVEETARRVLRRVAAEGALPLEAGGRRAVTAATEGAAALLDAFANAAGTVVEAPALSVDLPCGLSLRGRAPAARARDGALLLEWLVPSKSDKPNLLLRAWVALLTARATASPGARAQVAGAAVVGARVVGAGDAPKAGRIAGQTLASDATPDEALAALDDLGALWLACRAHPVPLFPQTSRAIADAWPAGEGGPELLPAELEAVRSAARAAWSPAEKDEQSDRWIAPLFGAYDPPALIGAARDPAPGTLAGLALRLWRPLLDAVARGKDLAQAWPAAPVEPPAAEEAP